MSLPNYLASIKSSGFYRFVWDKSAVPTPQAETMRLLIGYSEKGPFNTPVYIDNVADFNTTYGNISKRLERKGIFFHRLAQQALSAGPIYALNLKPFSTETISYIAFNPSELDGQAEITPKTSKVDAVYDTNRFWSIDADQLPTKINESEKYIYIASTDSKETSCTVFIRKAQSVSKSYNVTIRQWYNSVLSEDMPPYLEPIQDKSVSDYFIDIFVFRGKFTPELCCYSGALSKYFKVTDDEGTEITEGNFSEKFPSGWDGSEKISLKTDYTDLFGNKTDALTALADDENSNFLYKYQGSTIPYFKDGMGYYISADILFNKDNYDHKLLMKMDESLLDDVTEMAEADKYLLPVALEEGYSEPFEYLEGYTYVTLNNKNGSQFVDAIINVIETESGIRTALTNRVDIEYHYLVDTFNSYTDAIGATSKAKFALLAKEKDNTFAILNFPAMSEFINDKSENYKTNGKFDIEKIPTGYTLPSESQGASWCAYFTQVTFSDGTVKNYIPSAALVSNNFMNKWGARQPYYVVAGPTYGVINYSGMTGPDYNYGRSDLDVLEPMGVNAIIYVPRKGTYINSNQTAKQIPVSALSKIHVRELVIYLQDEIESMLQNYQWELNTQTLRDTIKQKADYLLDNIMNNGGIYAYKSICDETNNTPEVIDNEMVVIDIEIEPARSCGKMCQQLVIHKTGGISSQG